MRSWLLIAIALLSSARVHTAPPRDVIVDHDGGVDDLIAIALLMKSPDVHVRAIGICPADSYLDPATRATQLFVERLGGRDITIAQGHAEGTNPFPADWRNDAARVLGIKALVGAQPSRDNPVVADDAAHHLVKLLSGERVYTILETGPLTNIADALKINPSIKRNITRIYAMGGAVRVRGNVDQRGHDGSAEWNFFNQPLAASDVMRAGIPVTLVPLDVTNNVPLTRSFVARLAAQSSVASQLASQAWQIATQDPSNPYYFWDTLTAAALLDPSIVKTEPLKIRVVTSGGSQGRTVEDSRGARVDVALDASRQKVERMFLDLLAR